MTTYNVTKSKIGKEDIELGTGSFTRTLGDGTVLTLSQIDAEDIPIKDNGNLVNPPSDNVESALATIQTALDVEEALNSTHRGAGSPHTGHVDVTGDETIAGVKSFSSFPLTPSSAPTSDYQVSNKKYVDDTALLPAGVIMMWGTATAPTGWLLCDGSNVSIETYAALYAVIGTTFGDPGGGNFTLPDLRQKFVIGKAASGTGSVLAGTGGTIDHNHLVSTHTHTMVTGTTAISNVSAGGVSIVIAGSGDGLAETIPDGGTLYGVSKTTGTGSAGSLTAQNPPFIALNYIIRC